MGELPYRQIHLDFHTSPFIEGVGDKFNAEDFAAVLKSAEVNSINLFAKCHHGMYYYPTKIGKVHPSLKFDLLGEQLKVCRENGIRASVYTCVAWNEDWADRHPEWLQVGIDGALGAYKPFSSDYYTWRNLCLNNAEHKKYLKDELSEIYKLYKPEAFFMDIILQKNCICKTCTEEMKKSGLDPSLMEDVQKHDRLVEIGFMKEFYNYVKDIDDSLDIYFNGCPSAVDLVDNEDLSTESKRKYNSYIDIESLPSDLWGYTHFPISAGYLNTKDKQLTMMNGRFHMAWGDFGGLRTIEAMEYECFRGIANGAKCCVGDQLHPSGKIDPAVYERIGVVFKSIKEKERWCYGSSKVAQIGVYLSNLVMEETNLTNEGAYRIFTDLHHAFDFIDYTTDITGYEMIVLPDNVRLGSKDAEKIQSFINSGGRVLLTAKSGLSMSKDEFALDFGAVYFGEASYYPRYIRVNNEFSGDIPAMDYVMYERGESIKASSGAEVLAGIVNPYFNRTYEKYCSHRQTPPADIVSEPAIIRNGNVIYISNPLFKDYALNGNNVYKQIIDKCLNDLLPSRMLESNLPDTAEVTLRKQDNSIIVHVLHYIPQRKCRKIDIIDVKIPLYNNEFSVRAETKPKSVFLAPQQEQIDFKFSDGRVEFNVNCIDGHQMIVLEF